LAPDSFACRQPTKWQRSTQPFFKMTMRVVAAIALLMAAPVASSLALKSARAALERDMVVDMTPKPVMKVVKLLQDMLVELNAEMEDDKAVYELLKCWCKTNEEEKTKEIAIWTARITEIYALIDEYEGKMGGFKLKFESSLLEYQSDWEMLQKAIALRMKEMSEFHMRETELIVAIKAAKGAIISLSKHHPDFLQVQKAAKMLQKAQVSLLIDSTGALSKRNAEVLREFVNEAAVAGSFAQIPGMKSYAPQSGQIFGILKQMKEEFEKDLASLQEGEKKAAEDFAKLKLAKETELAAEKKLQVELDALLGEFKEKHANILLELENLIKLLADGKTFLAKLLKMCANADAEYEARMKARLAEIAACEDAIKIINSDEAFANFGKTVGFLQIAAEGQEAMKARMKVVSLLRDVAAHSTNPRIALIMTSAQLDAFEKVKAEIDKMVAELTKQQAEEVEQRDWCVSEMNENERDTAAEYDKKAKLEATIADLKKEIKSLGESIEQAKADIAETQVEMGKRGDNREAENADYQQTISDQRLTQMILKKALDRLKQVYLLQKGTPAKVGAAHISMSGDADDPGNGPARFTKYEKNDSGGGVVAMIEGIIADSVKAENEAIASEQDSQYSYETFMKDSNELIIKLTKQITDMTEARAKAKVALNMAETDFTDTMKVLEGLAATLADLHGSCDYILKNFDARQAARSAEMDALAEAKAILSGMK